MSRHWLYKIQKLYLKNKKTQSWLFEKNNKIIHPFLGPIRKIGWDDTNYQSQEWKSCISTDFAKLKA